MGFLSKIIPNELKHGGWVAPLASIAGFALGGPAGAAAGAGLGRAASGGNLRESLTSAGLGYLGGSLATAGGVQGGNFFNDFGGLATTAGTAAPGFGADIFASSQGFVPGSFELGTSAGGASAAAGLGSSVVSGAGQIPANILELLKKLGLGGMVPGGGPLSTAVNLGSALYGLKGAHDLRALGKTAGGFDPERAGYATQLRELNANPASIVNRPNFAAGESALINRMKAQGYLGSGNMADAVAKYGSDFFTSESNRLGQLAGAQFAPGAGGNLAVSSMDLASKALASLGYGARSLEEIFGRKKAA